MRVFVFCLFFLSVYASNQKRTLVLLDSWIIRDTHSLIFGNLKGRGHSLTFKIADDPSIALSEYGVQLYDNLIIFAPGTQEFGGRIDVKQILDFVDHGGNVLVAADSRIGEAIREFGASCGVEFDEANTALIDHFNYDVKDGGNHTLVIAYPEQLINVPVISGRTSNPLLFRGIGLSNDPDNHLLINVLKGTSTTYSYYPHKRIDEYPTATGKATSLISAMQARNNARMAFIGSLEFFSNDFFSSSVKQAVNGSRSQSSGNRELTDSLTRWVFQESGVLRIAKTSHEKIDGVPDILADTYDSSDYTIMDTVRFAVVIEELVDSDPQGRTHKWNYYDGTDVQLSVVRIDPFIRKRLKKMPNGEFSLTFKLPDVYGVFQFVVDYNRVGYTHLFNATQVSVRPLRHTQYERFIEMAYPYYTSAFSMMIGVFLFSFVYIHHRNDVKDKKD